MITGGRRARSHPRRHSSIEPQARRLAGLTPRPSPRRSCGSPPRAGRDGPAQLASRPWRASAMLSAKPFSLPLHLPRIGISARSQASSRSAGRTGIGGPGIDPLGLLDDPDDRGAVRSKSDNPGVGEHEVATRTASSSGRSCRRLSDSRKNPQLHRVERLATPHPFVAPHEVGSEARRQHARRSTRVARLVDASVRALEELRSLPRLAIGGRQRDGGEEQHHRVRPARPASVRARPIMVGPAGRSGALSSNSVGAQANELLGRRVPLRGVRRPGAT